jgi:hypothetical protein
MEDSCISQGSSNRPTCVAPRNLRLRDLGKTGGDCQGNNCGPATESDDKGPSGRGHFVLNMLHEISAEEAIAQLLHRDLFSPIHRGRLSACC